MVSCLSIVKALQAPEVEIRGFGRIVVDPATIEAGNNCVVARCRKVGTGGDMLVKCYHRGRPVTEFFERTSYYIAALEVVSIDCGVEYVDVAFSEWVEGDALDKLLYCGECDYGALSRAFDCTALRHILKRVVHGDVQPANIIVTSDGSMRLVDKDLSPMIDSSGYDAKEYGSMLYTHRHRHLRRTDEYTDDYSCATVYVDAIHPRHGVQIVSAYNQTERQYHSQSNNVPASAKLDAGVKVHAFLPSECAGHQRRKNIHHPSQ